MCYENMNIAIETEEGLGIEYDEDVVCDVCRSPEGEDGNEMVFCDKCNVCVHQVSSTLRNTSRGSPRARRAPCSLSPHPCDFFTPPLPSVRFFFPCLHQAAPVGSSAPRGEQHGRRATLALLHGTDCSMMSGRRTFQLHITGLLSQPPCRVSAGFHFTSLPGGKYFIFRTERKRFELEGMGKSSSREQCLWAPCALREGKHSPGGAGQAVHSIPVCGVLWRGFAGCAPVGSAGTGPSGASISPRAWGARSRAPLPSPLCEKSLVFFVVFFFSFLFFLYLLILWAAFPSAFPGGGRALEICIVGRGGCFEWFPSVNQIPQNTRAIWGWFFGGLGCLFLHLTAAERNGRFSPGFGQHGQVQSPLSARKLSGIPSLYSQSHKFRASDEKGCAQTHVLGLRCWKGSPRSSHLHNTSPETCN